MSIRPRTGCFILSMLPSLFIFWGGQPYAQTADADSDTVSRAALQQAVNLAFSELGLYEEHSRTIWDSLKVLVKSAHGGYESVSSAVDALDAADFALSTGEIPASEGVNRLRTRLFKESDLLAVLARKSANDWLYDSGMNAFTPGRIQLPRLISMAGTTN